MVSGKRQNAHHLTGSFSRRQLRYETPEWAVAAEYVHYFNATRAPLICLAEIERFWRRFPNLRMVAYALPIPDKRLVL